MRHWVRKKKRKKKKEKTKKYLPKILEPNSKRKRLCSQVDFSAIKINVGTVSASEGTGDLSVDSFLGQEKERNKKRKKRKKEKKE